MNLKKMKDSYDLAILKWIPDILMQFLRIQVFYRNILLILLTLNSNLIIS
jgi:hypothetical protein